MPGKRTNVISWDEFFMRVAIAASLRSKDPNTQVGACIADTNHRILSVGYNGTPAGINDDEFPWETTPDPLLDKHSYVIHAEANAILNYRGSLKDMTGATVYVTLFPCHECAKTLVQAGIGEVVEELFVRDVLGSLAHGDGAALGVAGVWRLRGCRLCGLDERGGG